MRRNLEEQGMKWATVGLHIGVTWCSSLGIKLARDHGFDFWLGCSCITTLNHIHLINMQLCIYGLEMEVQNTLSHCHKVAVNTVLTWNSCGWSFPCFAFSASAMTSALIVAKPYNAVVFLVDNAIVVSVMTWNIKLMVAVSNRVAFRSMSLTCHILWNWSHHIIRSTEHSHQDRLAKYKSNGTEINTLNVVARVPS